MVVKRLLLTTAPLTAIIRIYVLCVSVLLAGCIPVFGQVKACTSGDVYGIEQRGIQALRSDWQSIVPARGCPVLWQVIAGPKAECNSEIALLEPPPNYRYLAHLMDNFSSGSGPLARLSCLNDGVVIDIRDRDGTIKHEVLRAPDPLLIEDDGVTSTILHVHFSQNSLLQTVFVQTTGQLSRDLGRKIYDGVARRLGIPPAFVKIRSDSFFVETGFPPLYPFSAQPVPTEEQYSKTATLVCSGTGCGLIRP